MKRSENILLSFTGAVMEFTWLYAWAAFSAVFIAQRNFPLLDAAVIFLAAASVTGLSTGRGLRVISIALLQAAGLVYAVLRTIYFFSDAASAFLGRQWLARFFGTPHSAIEWSLFAVSAFWACAFWAGGALLAVRPKTYGRICSRFDLGLAAFFCLALMKLALLVKGNMSIDDHLTGFLACIFFFFGLTSIGMVRGQTAVSSDLISGYRKLGVVMGFICTVLASVISLAAFSQQPLTSAARVSYGLIKGGAFSLGTIFTSFIRFLYSPAQTGVGKLPSEPKGSMLGQFSSSDSAGWVEVAGNILGWLFGTAFGLIIFIIIVSSAIYFIRWLFSRTPEDGNNKSRDTFSPQVIVRAWGLFILLAGKIRQALRGYRTAADFYMALVGWSRRSGVSRRRSETPSEFCSRLMAKFPTLKEEIASVVGAFNREFYGEMNLDSGEITLVRLAWHKLRSPACWSLRLKTIFSGRITSLP